MNATSTEGTYNSTSEVVTMGNEDKMEHMVPDETGAIVGVVFGLVVSLVMAGIAAYLYRKHKLNRDTEFRRTKRAQLSSMMNAGVYLETTTENLMDGSNLMSTGSKDSAYVSLSPKTEDLDSDDEI